MYRIVGADLKEYGPVTADQGNVDGQRTREEIFLVGFADGSVKRVPRSQLNTLRWDP
jgi:hypothetical protein